MRRDIRRHLSQVCPQAMLPCQWCDDLIERSELEGHEKRQCLYREVTCRNTSCEQTIAMCDRDSHEDRCPHRTIRCLFPGCPILYIPSQQTSHEKTCMYKPLHCKYRARGCAVALNSALLDQHVAVCPYKK
jgi:hypothetical protein